MREAGDNECELTRVKNGTKGNKCSSLVPGMIHALR